MVGTPGALIFFCFFSSIKRRKEGLWPPAKFSSSRFGYIPYPAKDGRHPWCLDLLLLLFFYQEKKRRAAAAGEVFFVTFRIHPVPGKLPRVSAETFFARFPQAIGRKSLWRAISSGFRLKKFFSSDFLRRQLAALRSAGFSLPLFRFSPIPVIHLHPSERTIRNEYKIVITYKTTRYADH